MKKNGKKKISILKSLKSVSIGCIMAIGVCAMAFAADPTELLGDNMGIENLDAMVASVTQEDVNKLEEYMEEELISRVEYDSDEAPVAFLSAYLEEDETFAFTVKKYFDGNLA